MSVQGAPAAARRIGVIALALATFLSVPASSLALAAEPRFDRSAGPAATGFRLNLYRAGDHVPQYTATWCIGASIQMMANMAGATDDETQVAQREYMVLARTLGRQARRMAGLPIPRGAVDDGVLRGAGSGGWARALSELGAGQYEEIALNRYASALKTAAVAMRRTNRPVGLIVWRGVHAWVMSGFTATADPLTDPNAQITGAYVLDPWYPRVSSIWGRGQRPNTYLSSRALARYFLPRFRGRWAPELEGKFVLVAPSAPIGAVAPPPAPAVGVMQIPRRLVD